jgi:hypothetical protein
MHTGNERRRGVAGLALLAMVFVTACHATRPGGSITSESHFLMQCAGDCPDGLSCICGVCSAACTNDQRCAKLSAQASCRAATDMARDPACGTATPSTACDLSCNNDSDCSRLSAAHRCDRGHCRRAATMTPMTLEASHPADAGASKADSGTGAPRDAAQIATATPDGGARSRAGGLGGSDGSTALSDAGALGGADGGPTDCPAVTFHVSAGGPPNAPPLCVGVACNATEWLTVLDEHGDPLVTDQGCAVDCAGCQSAICHILRPPCNEQPLPVMPSGVQAGWSGMQWTKTGTCSAQEGGGPCSTLRCAPPGRYTARFCGWVLQADQVGSEICNNAASRTQKCADVPFDYPTTTTLQAVIDPTCARDGESCLMAPCCGGTECCQAPYQPDMKTCYPTGGCPAPAP